MVRSASSRVSGRCFASPGEPWAARAAILRDGADAPPQEEVSGVSNFEFAMAGNIEIPNR
jgi:hypothetical protein